MFPRESELEFEIPSLACCLIGPKLQLLVLPLENMQMVCRFHATRSYLLLMCQSAPSLVKFGLWVHRSACSLFQINAAPVQPTLSTV